MTNKLCLKLFIAGALSLVGLTFSLTVKAQVRCESIFANNSGSQISYYRQSYPAFRELNNSSSRFFKKLENSKHELSQAEVLQMVKELQSKAEDYFTAAGISFEKSTTSTDIFDLKDTDKLWVNYPLYRLHGSRYGDENARQIYGAQTQARFKNRPLVIEFDLLHKINFGHSLAQFISFSNTVRIGANIISFDLLGLTTGLRHEIQHAFERAKLVNGEMTLMRIKLSNPQAVESQGYEKNLSADEIETHLRDLRGLVHSQREAKNGRLKQVLGSPQLKQTLVDDQKDSVLDSIHRLGDLVQRVKQAYSQIVFDLQSPQTSAFATSNSGVGIVHLQDLPGAYPQATIHIQGLVHFQTMNRVEIQTALTQILNWSRQRIEQIEKEMNTIEANVRRQQMK